MANMQKILIIYNPISGSFLRGKNDKNWIKKYFAKKNISTEIIETKADNSIAIENALKKPYYKILVAGGDGTVREIAHLLIKNKIKTPMGILPAGTMNFFALALGVPLPMRMALRYFLKHDAITLDAGLVNNEKYFFVACGIGYDAKFIKSTTRSIKKILGPIAYVILALKHSYSSERFNGHLIINDKREDINFSSLVAFNLRAMISKRKKNIYMVHPGVLDVLIAKAVTVPNALKLTHKILFRNRPKYQDVKLIQTKKLSFSSKNNFPYEIDGEDLETNKLDIEIIPNALNIIGRK